LTGSPEPPPPPPPRNHETSNSSFNDSKESNEISEAECDRDNGPRGNYGGKFPQNFNSYISNHAIFRNKIGSRLTGTQQQDATTAASTAATATTTWPARTRISTNHLVAVQLVIKLRSLADATDPKNFFHFIDRKQKIAFKFYHI
jgi:Down syndrome cell adhesion molecule C terminal